MMSLKARKEPSTYRTRRADLRRLRQGRLWGWGAAVALTVLCCSLKLAVADRPVDDTLPAWMQSALQQAAKFLATRAEQGMPQETPPVIAAFDVSPNASGQLATFQPYGPTQTVTNAFFADLGTNGRTCMTCHQPQNGWTISPQDVEARFRASDGKDPLFRPIDGATCPTDDVSTPAAMKRAYTLLLTKGLIRVAISLPANPQYTIRVVYDPYGCNTNPTYGLTSPTTGAVSVYRRPLPSTNLGFLSALMWDGREESLGEQAIHATQIHAAGTKPTDTQIAQIVSFELGLYTAQFMDNDAGSLEDEGAMGGPIALSQQPFFKGINDPLGQNPTGAPFNPVAFTLYAAWERLSGKEKQQEREREAIAHGAQLFNTRPIAITGVAGLNNALVPSVFMGTCTTCHDTPNVGNHSVRLPLNIGISDVSDAKHPPPDLPLFELQCPGASPVQTTDPGRALITGQCADIGKFKGPILRALAARPPYFHNGSAATLEEVVAFYNDRFQLNLTHQEQADLVAFLRAL